MATRTKEGPVTAKAKPPAAGKGRPKGAVNKTTATLKDAILLAAKAVGQDGKGKGGLQGYLQRVAREDTKSFTTLLGKVLPIQAQMSGPNGEALPSAQLAPVFNITLTNDGE